MDGTAFCIYAILMTLLALAPLALPAEAGRQPAENLGRGLVAVPAERGVFLSWRLLAQDPTEVAFRVSRRVGTAGRFECLTPAPLTAVTNYHDEQAPPGEVSYRVEALANGMPLDDASTVTVRASAPQAYLRIPLAGSYRAHKVCLGDLDGDGEMELVIQQPDFNTDPYQQPGYWKVSPTTYKLEAYKLDGRMLWRYDMGWAIEAGTWYAPYTVFDLDGDGRAEVYCKAGEGDPREPTGHVMGGPEYLVKLDGKTGKVVDRAEWLTPRRLRGLQLPLPQLPRDRLRGRQASLAHHAAGHLYYHQGRRTRLPSSPAVVLGVNWREQRLPRPGRTHAPGRGRGCRR